MINPQRGSLDKNRGHLKYNCMLKNVSNLHLFSWALLLRVPVSHNIKARHFQSTEASPISEIIFAAIMPVDAIS